MNETASIHHVHVHISIKTINRYHLCLVSCFELLILSFGFHAIKLQRKDPWFPNKKQLRNDPWFMSHRGSNAIVFRRFQTGCYLISFEWRNTVLNSPCWLLLLSSKFKLELIYAQETLSRSPLTSIENMNSQNQQKQSITQNSSKFQKTVGQFKKHAFLASEFSICGLSHPMSPQDCQSATGGKNRRIRQSFFGQSIQISSAAAAPSHREGLSNSNYDRIYDDKINLIDNI